MFSTLICQKLMKRKIKDIADIQNGYSFRSKIETAEDGNVRVLQIRDIDSDGRVLTDDLIRIDFERIKRSYFLKKDDVLFTTRGINRRAGCVLEEIPDAIFVAQISALRVKSEVIIPQYLAWYLNQKPAQNYFDSFASSSHIQNIKMTVLNDLGIEIPSIETQQKITEIDRLHRRENDLIEILKEKRGQLIEQTLINASRKKEK